MIQRIHVVLTVLLLVLAGCSKGAERPASTLTEAQRDSAIARSSLPGADVVGRAMQVSGREARRAGSMDATVDSLSR